jgi:hypothetical protein
MHHVAGLSIILVLCFPAPASAARPSKLSPAAAMRLTNGTGTVLNTPNLVVYKVAARTSRRVAGLPIDTGKFSGFYPQ